MPFARLSTPLTALALTLAVTIATGVEYAGAARPGGSGEVSEPARGATAIYARNDCAYPIEAAARVRLGADWRTGPWVRLAPGRTERLAHAPGAVFQIAERAVGAAPARAPRFVERRIPEERRGDATTLRLCPL